MNGQNDQQIQPEATGSVVTRLSGVNISTDTPAGAAWARKYLHPPCATSAEYCGIPDKNNTPSTCAEYKCVQQIQTQVPTGDGTTVANFNKILLLHTSSVIAPVIAFSVDTTGAVTQRKEDVVLSSNINVNDMVGQNSSGRLAYKSTTSSLNATAFSNQGVVTCGQFRPNISFISIGDLVRFAASRGVLEGFAPKLLSRHAPLSSAAPSKGVTLEEHVIRELGDTVSNAIQLVQFGQLPTNSTRITMMSPNATSAVATQGSFLVQKFDQDSIPYHDFAYDSVTAGGVTTLRGRECYWFAQTIGNTGQLDAFNVANQPGNTTGVLVDLPWFDFNWGWTLYEGLSVNGSQLPATTVLPPYITVKCITGLEFQPLPDSVLSPFIRNCATYDFSALRMATMLNNSVPDSYPEKYNFWGTVGQLLLGAAPQIIDTIKQLFATGKKVSDKGQQKKRPMRAVMVQPANTQRAVVRRAPQMTTAPVMSWPIAHSRPARKQRAPQPPMRRMQALNITAPSMSRSKTVRQRV